MDREEYVFTGENGAGSTSVCVLADKAAAEAIAIEVVEGATPDVKVGQPEAARGEDAVSAAPADATGAEAEVAQGVDADAEEGARKDSRTSDAEEGARKDSRTSDAEEDARKDSRTSDTEEDARKDSRTSMDDTDSRTSDSDSRTGESDVGGDACEAIAAGEAVAADEAEDVGADVQPGQVIEALLFAADTPLSAGRLAELSGLVAAREMASVVEALNEKYAAAGLSFRIEEIARGYQMLTVPAYQPWLAKLDKHRGQTRLTAAALETLSIVAYKQLVIRAEVESIRGVACGDGLNRLREMGLIKIVGRAEIIGRPMLYGTTKKFLDVFGLADLDDLPAMETLSFKRPAAVVAPAVTAAVTMMALPEGVSEPAVAAAGA
jgi:segregation and condensation protein B